MKNLIIAVILFSGVVFAQDTTLTKQDTMYVQSQYPELKNYVDQLIKYRDELLKKDPQLNYLAGKIDAINDLMNKDFDRIKKMKTQVKITPNKK